MDDELVQVAREAIGAHFGLSPQQAARLRGFTRSEIEADAATMCGELGLPVPGAQGRDGDGRFAGGDMNRRIREAAGR